MGQRLDVHDHPIVMFEEKDEMQSNPMPASKFLLIDRELLSKASNLNLENVFEDIAKTPHAPPYDEVVILFMLDVLRAFDETGNARFLDLAENICEWIGETAEENGTSASENYRLNKLQIIKRKRALKFDELETISSLRENGSNISIRCGAYLLFDDQINAQKCFHIMNAAQQEAFRDFPIFKFAKFLQ